MKLVENARCDECDDETACMELETSSYDCGSVICLCCLSLACTELANRHEREE